MIQRLRYLPQEKQGIPANSSLAYSSMLVNKIIITIQIYINRRTNAEANPIGVASAKGTKAFI